MWTRIRNWLLDWALRNFADGPSYKPLVTGPNELLIDGEMYSLVLFLVQSRRADRPKLGTLLYDDEVVDTSEEDEWLPVYVPKHVVTRELIRR